MPVTGRKPKEGGAIRHRVKPTHDWTEVPGVPYEDGPELDGRWSAKVLAWWDSIRRMPHCVLWDESDWKFAMDTAYVVKAYYGGNIKAAAELRQREKIMGKTYDARRDLRIRYVEPAIDAPAGISAIDEYRKMLQK
jgi:hypothetical protein